MGALTPVSRAALLALGLLTGGGAGGLTLRASLELEGDVYPHEALYPDQSDRPTRAAVIGRVQSAAAIDPDTDLVFDGRVAVMNSDPARTVGDISRATIERRAGGAVVNIGILDERWGVLDAWNPANVVNQLDLADDYQGGTRLGQPGIALKFTVDEVTVTLIGGAGARARRLPSTQDRYRIASIPVAESRFEGGRAAPFAAARAAYRAGDLEVAASHFHGTSREPEISVVVGPRGPALRADYLVIDQTAVEAQYLWKDYVLRGEAIHRSGQTGRSFFGAGVGVERIFYGAFGGPADLQLFGEYYRDDRPRQAPTTAFQNDLSLGGKLILNNPGSTEFSLRATLDLEHGSQLVEAGAQHRIGADNLVGLELTAPIDVKRDPALASFQRDTRVRLSFTHFFSSSSK